MTQYFVPERNVIMSDIARALARSYDVQVVTSQPNFPTGVVFDGFAWYQWRTRDEDGIRVTRVPAFTYRGLNIIARAIGYLVFGLGASLSLFLSVPKADVYLVYQTPMSSAWGVALARWIYGGQVVHVIVDLWPESMLAAGLLREGVVTRLVGALRRWTNFQAQELIVTTPSMVPLFAGEGYPAARMVFVPVWTDAQRGLTRPAPVPATGGIPYVVYAGTIGPSQALGTFIRALGLLQARGVRVGARIAGVGVERGALEETVRTLGVRDVEFLGSVHPLEVARLIQGAVAQVVSLVSDPRFDHTIPSKSYTAIGCGVPILAGVRGDALALLERSGLGIGYPSDDHAAMARAIEVTLGLDDEKRAALAAQGWEFYTRELSPESALARIVGIVEGLMPGTIPVRAAT